MDGDKVLERARQRGIALNGTRPPTRAHPATRFEAPCVVQGSIEWPTPVQIGAFSVFYGGALAMTTVGRYCSIASAARLGAAEHPMDRLTSSILGFQPRYHEWCRALGADETQLSRWSSTPFRGRSRTTIGNDVWLGADVFVKSGVTIGDGAVVAARSLVTRDIPPYAIAVGTPARVVRMRFDDATIERLLSVRWWRFSLFDLAGLDFADIHHCLDEIERREAEGTLIEYGPVATLDGTEAGLTLTEHALARAS